MASVLRTLRHRRASSELPSFECIDMSSSSIGSDDSKSSLDDDEMLFNSRIQESFPLSRNVHQQIVEARRSVLLKVCIAAFVIGIVAFNSSFIFTNNGATPSQRRDNMFESPWARGDHVARRLTAEKDQVHSLMNLVDDRKLQQVSLQKVEELFGRGPHLVEFEIQIWGEQNTSPEQHFFTVEMAPTHLMPTSVYYFLQQVTKGLWSGTSIHLNTDHVIAAQPAHGNGVSLQSNFDASGVGSLPFIEYSNAYPHAPYTLGFVGTGPSFFINKKWNLHEEACFANVVVGRQSVDKIAALRGDATDPSRIRPVDIVAVQRVEWQNLNDKAKAEYAVHSLQRTL